MLKKHSYNVSHNGTPKNTGPKSFVIGTGALSSFTPLVSPTLGLSLHTSSVFIKRQHTVIYCSIKTRLQMLMQYTLCWGVLYFKNVKLCHSTCIHVIPPMTIRTAWPSCQFSRNLWVLNSITCRYLAYFHSTQAINVGKMERNSLKPLRYAFHNNNFHVIQITQ